MCRGYPRADGHPKAGNDPAMSDEETHHRWVRTMTDSGQVQMWCLECDSPAAQCSRFVAEAFGDRT